jgi:RIO kinase 2
MKLDAIEAFKNLKAGDFRMLETLERWMRRYEFVPVDKLPSLCGIPEKDVNFFISRLNKYKLVVRQKIGYVGYKLLPAGHDALAIRSLVDKNVLQAFGNPLGIGKEADVYDALMPDGTRVAVKFHRLGRTSFKSVVKLRPYQLKHDWMYLSRAAAEREFNALQKLYPKVSVPKPIALDRHVVVMGLIDGVELANVESISDPKAVLDEIIHNVRLAFELGVIHADLSEHNVIIKPDGEVLIIDWPQWVPSSHEGARSLLERDVKNLTKFFRRKFGLKVEVPTFWGSGED